MTRVKEGGLLFTFSCSAAIVNHKPSEQHQQKYFTFLMQEAAQLVGKSVTIVRELDGGNDHPIHIANPESKYLTGLLLRIS